MGAYLYGVLPAEDAAGACARAGNGLAGAPVRPVTGHGLAALVSDLQARLPARRRHVLAHAGVLERALGTGTLLPFRFGTVLPDDGAVAEHLARGSGEFRRQLDRFAGLVQLTVAARQDRDVVIGEVVRAEPRLRDAAGAGTLDARIEAGRAIAARVAQRREADTRLIVDRLAPLAQEADLRVGEDEDRLLRLALLVRPDGVREVERAAAGIAGEAGGRLLLDVAGPTPPYDFVGG